MKPVWKTRYTLHFTHRIIAHNKHVPSLNLIQASTSMKIGEQSNSISMSMNVYCTNLHQIIVLLVYTRLYSMYNYNWHNKARTERTTCLHDIAWTAQLRIFATITCMYNYVFVVRLQISNFPSIHNQRCSNQTCFTVLLSVDIFITYWN